MALTTGSSLSAGGGASASLPPLSKVLVGTIEASGAAEVVFDTSAYDYDGYFVRATGVTAGARLQGQVNGIADNVYGYVAVYPNTIYSQSSASYFMYGYQIPSNSSYDITFTYNPTNTTVGVYSLMSGTSNRQGISTAGATTGGNITEIKLYASNLSGTFTLYGYYNTETTA